MENHTQATREEFKLLESENKNQKIKKQKLSAVNAYLCQAIYLLAAHI